jgi:hypothetical protein
MVAMTYRDMVKRLRASIVNEKDFRYLVHTPVGTITIDRWDYSLPGFVMIEGKDEKKEDRFLVFTAEQISSFPLEVRHPKYTGEKGRVGFKASQKAQTVENV